MQTTRLVNSSKVSNIFECNDNDKTLLTKSSCFL